MRKTKNCIIFFAFFATILVASLAFIQPITVQASDKSDLEERHDQYTFFIETLSGIIANNEILNNCLEDLSNNNDLNSIINQLKNAKTDEEIYNAGQNFEEHLLNSDEYDTFSDTLIDEYLGDFETLDQYAAEITQDLENQDISRSDLINNLIDTVQNLHKKTVSEQDIEDLFYDIEENDDEPEALRMFKFVRKIILWVLMLVGSTIGAIFVTWICLAYFGSIAVINLAVLYLIYKVVLYIIQQLDIEPINISKPRVGFFSNLIDFIKSRFFWFIPFFNVGMKKI
jgi:hypothetical protein